VERPQSPALGGDQPPKNNGCTGCLVAAAIVFSVVLTAGVIALVLHGLR
jgi:hypothetical protein